MHILILNDDYPPKGTSSVAHIAKSLADGYEKKGHTVSIITTHRIEESPDIIRQGNIISIPVSYRFSLRQYLSLYNPNVSKILQNEISKIKPNVVHAHNIHTYLTYHALTIARKHTPHVFLTAHDVMSFSYARLATARYLTSLGKDMHTTILDHVRHAGLQWNPLRNLIIRHVLSKNTEGVIAVSNSLADALRIHHIPVKGVIHHGIDCNAFTASPEDIEAFRERMGLQGKRVLLFGGRLSIDKGVMPLLKALDTLRKEIPDLMLLVLGEKDRWKGMLKAAHVSTELNKHIVVSGWVSREQLPAAYAVADVVTTPSLCLDTFNLMNIEAAASGKPVVGTIFGGTPEIIIDGKTGYIRNPLDLPAFTEALHKLLLDTNLAKTMGEAGKKHVENAFSLDAQILQYLHLFKRT